MAHRRIELARRRHQLDIWAYVIMPEHVHLLIYPRADEYSISRILSTLKQPVSKRSILFVQREAPTFLPHRTDAQPNGKTEMRFWKRGGGSSMATQAWTMPPSPAQPSRSIFEGKDAVLGFAEIGYEGSVIIGCDDDQRNGMRSRLQRINKARRRSRPSGGRS